VLVAVYHNNRDVRIEERPVPQIGPGELLLRVRASGVCGSDVMEWYRVPRAPLVLGHEVAGEVAAIGESAPVPPGTAVETRAFVSHHVPCLQCRYCRAGHETACDTLRRTNFDPGGFSEYIRVPAVNVRLGFYPLPEGVSFERGAFVEPLGCTVRGQRAAGVAAGDAVLVLGSGLTGLLHIKLARARGAEVYATDPVPFRRNAAVASGAVEAFDARDDVPGKIRAALGRPADRVIVCTGAAPALAQALRCVDRGGSILFFAPTDPGREVPIPLNDLWHDEVTLTNSYGAAPKDIAESIELLRSGALSVEDLISHRLPLKEAAEAFRLTADAKESLKVILYP
jgi:L-iditol 2-dehydrogenase